MVWHVIVIDDEPGPNGWSACCTPHGLIGEYPTRLEAFLRALEHDVRHGGQSC